MQAYSLSSVISLGLGFLFRYTAHKLDVNILSISRKEAFGIVALGWVGTGLLSGLPFLFENSITTLSASTFEAISGLTTTGATVIDDIESLSRATHLWRVLLHWIGGMGIVVLFVAIFPQMGLGGKHLFKTEVAGPITEGLKPRIKQTALRLWWIYMFFTATCTGLLYLSGLSIFDAVCHSFSTLSTGGFSTKGDSLGAFDNPLAEWVVIFFMLAGGINFGLYYGLFRGNVSKLFSSIEVRFFVLLNMGVALLIFISTTGLENHDWHEEFRDALFQTVAVSTTTGLMTADFDTYPLVSKYLLFLCMFVGGCAGSTAGGLKVSRVLLVFKRCLQELRLTLHPQEVVSTKLGRQTISRRVLSSIFIFVCTYFLLYIFGVFIMFAVGLDWTAATSSVVAALSSVGPGFGDVGPTKSYSFIHPLGQYVLCFYMIAGRLEIFVLLTLFTPSFWRKG
jgi:trk system potassium uptake protein TrkH